MCQEQWYHYTCDHLIPARDNQEAWAHCAGWVEGPVEADCPNFHDNGPHATEEVDSQCQECEYLTPPASSESSDSGNGNE